MLRTYLGTLSEGQNQASIFRICACRFGRGFLGGCLLFFDVGKAILVEDDLHDFLGRFAGIVGHNEFPDFHFRVAVLGQIDLSFNKCNKFTDGLFAARVAAEIQFPLQRFRSLEELLGYGIVGGFRDACATSLPHLFPDLFQGFLFFFRRFFGIERMGAYAFGICESRSRIRARDSSSNVFLQREQETEMNVRTV